MTNTVKKHEFLLPFARIFTRSEKDAYDSIQFQSSDSFGDEGLPALASPTTWSVEAVEVIAEAAAASVPAHLRAIEENTVPSWLWHHQSRAGGREREADLRDIFNRVTGSAAAKAWKLGLFTSEKQARSFYDEARYALMQRHIAIAPEVLASWGLAWAYGIEETAISASSPMTNAAELSNAAIDSLIGKTKSALWQKLFAHQGPEASTITLRLSDIASDWHSAKPSPARAAIDLMALRHNDGSMNIDALRQAARILTVLLDLQDRNDVTIGFANLAPLMLALGLAYDSDAARALAASLAALVTAECTATSAELAGLRGASDAFGTERDVIMRSLRNHRRAVYGDGNDYEKLSVLPAPLPLKNCPDLTLVAEAQRRWDEALELARAFGLRATQATDMTPSPRLSLLMGSATQGLEPMPRLTSLQQNERGEYQTVLHAAAGEALVRLAYPRSTANATVQHIVGSRSLRKAPSINHATLRAKGLSETAIEQIDAYIPNVDSIRLAVTPWIVGIDYCETKLKIPARRLQSPRFDLLKYLGFSDADIASANLHCYGYGTARNAKILHLRHRPLFACGAEISNEARMRMAASVQSFISGDTGVTTHLPVLQNVQRGAEITLSAWQRGLKSLTIIFDPALAPQPARKVAGRRLHASTHPTPKALGTVKRMSKGKKSLSAPMPRKPTERRTRYT